VGRKDNDNDNEIGKRIKVYIEPTLDRDKILRALKLVPSYWRFSIEEWNESKFEELRFEGWENFPFPKQSNEMTIIDGAVRKVKKAGGCWDSRVGVAVFGWENTLILGLRIWHELLHTEKLLADDMMRNPDFIYWLPKLWKAQYREYARDHDSLWELVYYWYLMRKLI
jgi:hypothetical protein